MKRSLFILIVLVSTVTGAGAYGPADLLYTFEDERIRESSGCAMSAHHDGLLYTHNDSGDTARVFAVDHRGRTVGTIDVLPVAAADWEDMARGPGRDGRSSLYVAEIGDNDRLRPFVTVYEFPEPGPVDARIMPAHGYNLVYPTPRQDAEALMVTPQGSIVIVTKSASGVSNVYVADALVDAAPTLMRKVASLDLVSLGAENRLVTGGDISPDGTKLVVRTYREAFEWQVQNGDLATTFAAAPARIALTETEQGEAICYSREGTALITTSEGVGAPVHAYAA